MEIFEILFLSMFVIGGVGFVKCGFRDSIFDGGGGEALFGCFFIVIGILGLITIFAT